MSMYDVRLMYTSSCLPISLSFSLSLCPSLCLSFSLSLSMPLQVLRNKPTKMAYLFVPEATEQCQKDCGIAQMWATLFWSSQIAMSLGYLHIYLYKSAKVPLVPIAVVQKILVGLLLIKAHKVCRGFFEVASCCLCRVLCAVYCC